MNKTKFLFWTPRIILIVFALFLAIFSFDIFDSAISISQIIIGLLLHNIPSIILVIILILVWKRDFVGAIIFLTLGTLCLIGAIISLIFLPISRFNPILIIGTVIFLLIGFLFLLGWKKKKHLYITTSSKKNYEKNRHSRD